MMYHLTVATVWWGEPIMLFILPPQDRKLRQYVTVKSSHQSGTPTHVQGGGVGTQPLPSMPSLDKGLLEAQTPMSQEELTRDVQDLDDDELWELLEALQTETTRREGTGSPLGSPQGNQWGPGVTVRPKLRMGKWTPNGRDGGMSNLHIGLQAPLRPLHRCWPTPQHACGWA